MLTDVAALVIALLAIKMGKNAPDEKRTSGYRRFEILAAAFNAVLLFFIAIYVFVEAIKRFNEPQEIQSWGMLIVAAIGLGVNLISMRLLTAGKEAGFNVKGAFLEVWANMIGSIGVIVGALAIKFTGWTLGGSGRRCGDRSMGPTANMDSSARHHECAAGRRSPRTRTRAGSGGNR